MKNLLERANQIDEAKFLSDQKISEKIQVVAEWNSEINNLRSLLDRDFNNPPTEHDWEKLEFVKHIFKK